VDLAEYAGQYVLTVEVPGIRREDISIDFNDGVLHIRGLRPPESSCPERYHQLERGQGRFSRSFRFASPVSTDAVTADLADGILTVVVPKARPTERTEVPVRSGVRESDPDRNLP